MDATAALNKTPAITAAHDFSIGISRLGVGTTSIVPRIAGQSNHIWLSSGWSNPVPSRGGDIVGFQAGNEIGSCGDAARIRRSK